MKRKYLTKRLESIVNGLMMGIQYRQMGSH